MTYNARRRITDEEAFELAVQHVLHDDLHWPAITTEEQARAEVRRLRSETRGISAEAAAERRADQYALVIDLTDPATRAAYYQQSA